MIVVDTNVLVALADRRDAHHVRCRDWLAECDDQLVVLPTVLAEACYMIDRFLGPSAEATFLDSVGIGPAYRFQLAELVDTDVRRMAALVRRYADRRLGGTAASVIAVCERLSVATVATMNRRDFANVRPRHVTAFAIVPRAINPAGTAGDGIGRNASPRKRCDQPAYGARHRWTLSTV